MYLSNIVYTEDQHWPGCNLHFFVSDISLDLFVDYFQILVKVKCVKIISAHIFPCSIRKSKWICTVSQVSKLLKNCGSFKSRLSGFVLSLWRKIAVEGFCTWCGAIMMLTAQKRVLIAPQNACCWLHVYILYQDLH